MDVLNKYGDFLFRRSDFTVADSDLGGTQGFCPVLLSLLVLLQTKNGWTDEETIDRAQFDMRVKACLNMGIGESGPSQATLCKHRQQMQALGLDQVATNRLRDLLEALELVRDDEAVLIDSVPIRGAGQQLDTYNLLASAIRGGLHQWAAQKNIPVTLLAESLNLEKYLCRSVKGKFDVDWDNEDSRNQFIAQLVHDARIVRQGLRDLETGPDESEPIHGLGLLLMAKSGR